MNPGTILPTVVYICHENDRLDVEGLGAWLACCFNLVGVVELREKKGSVWRKLRREYRRVGLLRLLDVLLFRFFYVLRHARGDHAWLEARKACLKQKYPANSHNSPHLVAYDPNSREVEKFLLKLQPDITIARCKFILKPEIFTIPRFGTFVLHPGICPQYRNAHGCFWALTRRDMDAVGMTLLKVDEGIDTGPVYLQASYPFDELNETHIVIQYRVVLENLDVITRVLHAITKGTANPISLPRRSSVNWGQPWLTAYLSWKHAACRAQA